MGSIIRVLDASTSEFKQHSDGSCHVFTPEISEDNPHSIPTNSHFVLDQPSYPHTYQLFLFTAHLINGDVKWCYNQKDVSSKRHWGEGGIAAGRVPMTYLFRKHSTA